MLQHVPKNYELKMVIGEITFGKAFIQNPRQSMTDRRQPLNSPGFKARFASQPDQRSAPASDVEQPVAGSEQRSQLSPFPADQRGDAGLDRSNKFPPLLAIIAFIVIGRELRFRGLTVQENDAAPPTLEKRKACGRRRTSEWPIRRADGTSHRRPRETVCSGRFRSGEQSISQSFSECRGRKRSLGRSRPRSNRNCSAW
jgi:hypothetical protein